MRGGKGYVQGKKTGLSLYHKFALVIIATGVIPLVILSTFVFNGMIREYSAALKYQYEQGANYICSSIESMVESYNTISKLPYHYSFSTETENDRNYLSFDNFRKMVYGEGYDPETMEEKRKEDMDQFFNYMQSADSSINAIHFVAKDLQGNRTGFHYSYYSSYFKDEDLFLSMMDYENLDEQSNKLMLIPTHPTEYFNGMSYDVFTVGRNYFDLRGQVGNTPYVGTLYLDVRVSALEKLCRSVNLNGKETVYVVNTEGDCFYSNDDSLLGKNVSDRIEELSDTEQQLVIRTGENGYGLSVIICMDMKEAFANIRRMQQMMYFCLFLSAVLILCGSVYFSKKLTGPMYEMMEQMERVGSGDFDIELTVRSHDEVGVLAERFNQMRVALKKYINQSYIAQIRQNEAELTALKSQIYPHFLYNTLEVIRMTALEEESGKVAEMIEALSEQIHYLIGKVEDMVPLEKEIDIVQKYVFLLNCRAEGKVQMTVSIVDEKTGAGQTAAGIYVPKLILQPIVENAFVHGIKPKEGKGYIQIEVILKESVMAINVMDNGVGMDEDALQEIRALLEGDKPGIKNEFNWQSIGLKNVHDRIRYLYGEEYGLQITSAPGMGTIVRILMPYVERTEREGDMNQEKEGTGV